MFDEKTILITGGTGSLGRALTKKLLDLNAKTIRIFSRNEFKQIEMETKLQDKKLLTIRSGENTIRILPPLNVKKSEIDIAIKIIRKVCKEF